MLDLFLAQPFGGRSLLQRFAVPIDPFMWFNSFERMFTSSLTEEVRALEDDIEAVKDKVDDPIMCEKIRQFVYAPREIQDMFKADAESEKMNIITVVLRSSEAPVLNRQQMNRLARAHRAHAEYTKACESLEDSDDDEGPQNEDAWLIEDLRVLTHKYQRLRDREQLMDLIFEVRPLSFVRETALTSGGHIGLYIGAPKRHHHDILLSSREGLPSSEHCGFGWRPSKLY